MTIPILIIGLLLLVFFYGVGIYNRLVKLKTLVEEAWSGIDVMLKKRHDLIPNLVETVRGYATHERQTLDSVTEARSRAMISGSVEERAARENELSQAMVKLNAVAEQYPDLKANENFQHLQSELSQIEGDIEKSRRYYNGTVRENNILVDTFPSNIIAGMFKFIKSPFFELEDLSEREVPKVEF